MWVATLICSERLRMNTIYLSSETVHIPFNAVDKIVAAAMYPDVADVSARMFYAVNLERELVIAVRAGQLQVLHHVYHSQLPPDVATPLLVNSLVAVEEVSRYVVTRGITIERAQPLSATPQLAGSWEGGEGTEAVLSEEEVAAILVCEPSTVQEKARLGQLPAVKIGRSWRFPVVALLESLNSKAKANEQRTPRIPMGVTVSATKTRQPPTLPNLPKTH